MGSTFKALTIGMGLDSGKMNLSTTFDARVPLRYGKFNISDYHGQNRILSIPEIFTYSSNIGAARVALRLGVEEHKAFLRKMGQLDRLRTELPESASPIVPRHWGELNTVTIAFGHGIAVAPLQAVPTGLEQFHLDLHNNGSELVYTYDTQAERTGIAKLLAALTNAGIQFRDLSTTQSSLEDIFVNLVKRSP